MRHLINFEMPRMHKLGIGHTGDALPIMTVTNWGYPPPFERALGAKSHYPTYSFLDYSSIFSVLNFTQSMFLIQLKGIFQ